MGAIGYEDRESLKEALGATLAKSIEEKGILGDVFERFFAGGEMRGLAGEASQRLLSNEDEPEGSALARMLLAGSPMDVDLAMREAGQAAGLNGIRFFTQKGQFIRNILDRMGWGELTDDIGRMSMGGDAAAGLRQIRLEEAKEELVARVRRYVEEQYDLFSASAIEELMESRLRRASLSTLEEHDFERMEALTRKIVKRMSTLFSRRLKASNSGRLDFKRTLRKSMAFQGAPFQVEWKKKRIDRAEIVAICDVSRSVRRVVRFLLLFLYSLSCEVARVRCFVLCSNMAEATPIFDQYPVAEALSRLERGTGLDILMGRTDYGEALARFKSKWLDEAISRKTTVIILGDARNNYGDPGTEVLAAIRDKCRRLVWLNPESPPTWGTGDSEMKRYLPYCNIAMQCQTLTHLEKFMDVLLK